MEDRKRTILAVVIALIVVVSLLYSFGMNLFSRTPPLELADPGTTESDRPGPTDPGEEAGIRVQVAPETVQSIVESLSRYESYSRVITAAYFWGDDETGTIRARVWETDGWCRTESLLPSGISEYSVTDGDRIWLWYDTEEDETELVYQGAAAEDTRDRLQYLPTYEEVLELDSEAITDAAYTTYREQSCIYVEAEQRELGYLYRYWISVNSGLLMAAETEKSGATVYRMESGEIASPLLETAGLFVLPDGTVLYEAD